MKVMPNGTGARVCLDQSPALNSCRPAVDALFTSIGGVYGGAVIAVVLTGMGQDGLRGAEIPQGTGGERDRAGRGIERRLGHARRRGEGRHRRSRPAAHSSGAGDSAHGGAELGREEW